MKKSIVILIALYLCTSFSTASFAQKKKEDHKKETNIQVAILLDTSGSMSGLIEQAKQQLWKMVNELALAKDSKGNIPNLTIALYEYGNTRIPKNISSDQIRQIVPLSNDLDKISEELFKLSTSGGDEYCGQVIQESTRKLEWSDSNDDLKIIFIAGNEAFTQGQVSYKDACKEAISKGIIINTIFCGDYQEGISTDWKAGADCADGKYMNIDHNSAVAHIDAPQDTRLAELNEALNKTYITYGNEGAAMKSRQIAQDSNASSYGQANAVQRVISKASKTYSNSSWDLVDALEEQEVSLDDMDGDALPDELKDKTSEERKAYIEEKAEERKEIQEEIQELSKKRRNYVDQERKKMADNNTLDQVIIKTIRSQAERNNYCFDE